jgi:hypothetical protein
MIAANELRIGSLINYEQTTHVITEISKTLVRHRWVKNQKDDYVSDFSEISPITLSPEILEKCGFEKANDNFGGYLSPLYKVGRIRINDNEWYNSCFYTTVKYLHQLQNLIFALTGTELEIKH